MTKQFIQIEKAIDKLSRKLEWCYNNNKPFRVQDYDLLCIDNISHYVDRNNTETPYKHTLLSKSVIFLLTNLIVKLDGLPDSEGVQQSLARIFEKPLTDYLSDLVDMANNQERMLFIKELGLDDGKHPANANREKQMEILSKLSPEQQKRLTQNKWDFERVKYISHQIITNIVNNNAQES